jgi:anti-repressor protein
MNELISIQNEAGKQTVNARDLWKYLESKRQFGNWITQRIDAYEFVEGVDFTTLNKNVNRQILKEYHISIDMAKELSMVENNEKGKQARRYFIEAEKKLKQFALPTTFSDALLLAGKLQKEIEEAQPKLEAHDRFLDAKGSYTMNEVAKQLNTGQNKLFERLRNGKILMDKKGHANHNTPYQTYIKRGYFTVRTTTINDVDRVQTLVTPKGLDWLSKLVKE